MTTFDARAFLRRKRDGGTHAAADVQAFIGAYMKGGVRDYQVSAWLMAAMLRGLGDDETGALTRALLDSGRRFDWSDLGRPTADKHSTGGVGDKISLPLAPLVAACDVLVPMVSGRGLGHTGGTLDKLESIPGFRTQLDPEGMRRQLDRLGVVMVGQGPGLAPADGMLYALRDVTSTVEFEPFIVSSIVSKKIAEGAGALVYDVKCGGGAFMKTRDAARSLARRLVTTTRALGAAATALITDMDWPIGESVGNALEVAETVAVLRGAGPADTRALTLDLAAEMLWLVRKAGSSEEARSMATRALDDGSAWRRFVELVEAQGGDVSAVERPERLPSAPFMRVVPAPAAGFVESCDAFAIGELVVAMGGGRRAKEDAIHPGVGLRLRVRRGQRVEAGEPLAELHLGGDGREWSERAAACFRIGSEPAGPAPASNPGRVLERID